MPPKSAQKGGEKKNAKPKSKAGGKPAAAAAAELPKEGMQAVVLLDAQDQALEPLTLEKPKVRTTWDERATEVPDWFLARSQSRDARSRLRSVVSVLAGPSSCRQHPDDRVHAGDARAQQRGGGASCVELLHTPLPSFVPLPSPPPFHPPLCRSSSSPSRAPRR